MPHQEAFSSYPQHLHTLRAPRTTSTCSKLQQTHEQQARTRMRIGANRLSPSPPPSSSPPRTTPRILSQQRSPELFRSGAVRAIPAKDAAAAMKDEGFRLLDVRPAWEREKARVKGSLHVPLFVEDAGVGPITLVKKWVHFGYIGAWTGRSLTEINEGFVKEVEGVVSDREEKLLVACGEGLRSLIAVKKLHKEGYKNLGWLAGGFNKASGADFPDVEGTTKLQYATIGGASYFFLQILLLLRVVGDDK